MTDAALAFHRRIDAALADAGLRNALALTTGRLASGRSGAFGALAGAEACRDQARRARAVAGERCADLPDAETCCGFGGLFAIKMGPLSSAMLDAKLEAIDRSGADVVVATDVSCLMHIGGGLHRRASRVRTRHIAEVLAGQGHD